MPGPPRWAVVAAVVMMVAAGGCGGRAAEPAGGTATTGAPAAKPAPGDPAAKIADVLLRAGERVATAAGGGADLLGLSDRVVRIDEAGRLEVTLHAAGPYPPSAVDGLRALGAMVVTELQGPQAWLVQAWVPHDRLRDAARPDWVVAVTPAERGATG